MNTGVPVTFVAQHRGRCSILLSLPLLSLSLQILTSPCTPSWSLSLHHHLIPTTKRLRLPATLPPFPTKSYLPLTPLSFTPRLLLPPCSPLSPASDSRILLPFPSLSPLFPPFYVPPFTSPLALFSFSHFIPYISFFSLSLTISIPPYSPFYHSLPSLISHSPFPFPFIPYSLSPLPRIPFFPSATTILIVTLPFAPENCDGPSFSGVT